MRRALGAAYQGLEKAIGQVLVAGVLDVEELDGHEADEDGLVLEGVEDRAQRRPLSGRSASPIPATDPPMRAATVGGVEDLRRPWWPRSASLSKASSILPVRRKSRWLFQTLSVVRDLVHAPTRAPRPRSGSAAVPSVQ